MADHTRPNRLALALGAGALAVLSLPVVLIVGLAGLGGTQRPATARPATAGVPARIGQAYQAAAGRCPGLDWTLLAAVGGVETNHGQFAGAAVDTDTGEATPWTFGPALNGTNHTAPLPIGPWTGWWGLAGPWQQAVGPMQFLPGTFAAHAVDADGDGTTNPHDVDDAVATTAAYLCSAAGDHLDGPDEIARIYNPGDAANYAAQLTAEQDRIHRAGQATRDVAAGLCPVAGPVSFIDSWGAPRSGGRAHQGVDMFAAEGTPVVAVAPGRVEHYNNSLGGLSYRLDADDRTFYYGTHLSAYANQSAGHVDAGTVIGYVGHTGNAATTPPHLHWEIHPEGRGTPAINPTPTADALCAANKT